MGEAVRKLNDLDNIDQVVLSGKELKKLLLQATLHVLPDKRFRTISREEARMKYGSRFTNDWFREKESDPNSLLKIANNNSGKGKTFYTVASLEAEINREFDQ